MNEKLLGEHFTPSEFRCGCGCGLGLESMQPELLRRLVLARQIANTPFILTSTIRCPQYNAQVGGVDSSAHVDGYAVDVASNNGYKRFQLFISALDAGFKRLGIDTHFIHLDCDPTKPAKVLWPY